MLRPLRTPFVPSVSPRDREPASKYRTSPRTVVNLANYATVDDAPDMTEAESTPQSAEGTMPPASPHFRVPLTDRFNYASLDGSAAGTHGAPRSQGGVEYPVVDAGPINVLAVRRGRATVRHRRAMHDIRIDTVQLANFEWFLVVCFGSLRLASQRRMVRLTLRDGRSSGRTCVGSR